MKRSIRLLSMLAALLLLLAACSTADEAGQADETSEPTVEETSEPMVEEESEPMVEETSEPAGDAGAAENQTIAEFAATNPSFGTLVQALEATGLADTLQEQGPFTVFAPNDEAFAQLDQDDLNALLADPSQLTDILEYHVAEGSFAASDLSDGQSLPTLQGSDLTVTVDGDTVMVDDATVVQSQEVGNGIIHVIDGVIRPPSS